MGKSFFEKRSVFSIRKLAVGACSVLIGVSFFGAPSVLAQEDGKALAEEEVTPSSEQPLVTEGAVERTTIEAPAVITPEKKEEVQVVPAEEKQTLAEQSGSDRAAEAAQVSS